MQEKCEGCAVHLRWDVPLIEVYMGYRLHLHCYVLVRASRNKTVQWMLQEQGVRWELGEFRQ